MFRRFRQDEQKNNSATPAINGSAPNRNGSSIQSVLGPGASFKGTLKVPHGARIDGTFEGSLEVSGPLVIGESARVIADIWAGSVTVAGTVKGNIKAEKVDILSSGRIYGDLLTNVISTEEGGFLRGTVEMTETAEESPSFEEDEAE